MISSATNAREAKMLKRILVLLVPVMAAAYVFDATLPNGVCVPNTFGRRPDDSMLVKLDSIPSQTQCQCISVRNDTVFCALQGGHVYYRDRLTGAVIDSFPTQAGSAVIAICPFGDSVCVSRLASPEFCEVYTLGGMYARSFAPTGGPQVRGLDWDGSHFWVTTFDGSEISIYLMTPNGTVTKTLSRSGGFPSSVARDLKLDRMYPNRLWTGPNYSVPNELMYVAFDTGANTFTPLDTFRTVLSSYMSGNGFRNDSVDGGCVYVSSINLSWIWRYKVHDPMTGAGEARSVLPPGFALSAGPNPTRSFVHISYATEAAGRADIGIYDAGGREVRSIISDVAGSGVQHATWALDDNSGRPVVSGVYFCRLCWPGRPLSVSAGGANLERELVVQR